MKEACFSLLKLGETREFSQWIWFTIFRWKEGKRGKNLIKEGSFEVERKRDYRQGNEEAVDYGITATLIPQWKKKRKNYQIVGRVEAVWSSNEERDEGDSPSLTVAWRENTRR
jgi:hypothetical protein